MSTLIDSSKLILLLLGGAGFYATWYLLLNNGTTDHMAHIRDVGPRLVPHTQEPLKTTYVGIEAVDYQLTVLDLFFWEMVDGSRPDASLFCYHFAGQVFSGWGLLLLESLRRGNSWRVVSFLALWGIAVQNLAYAVIIPLFLVVHLSTSPTVSSMAVADVSVEVSDILSIPIALIFGYALPTVLMSLPAPSFLDFATKQDLMAFWQFFPVWVSLLQLSAAFLIRFIGARMTADRKSDLEGKVSIKTLRSLYLLLIATAAVSQISTSSIVVISELFSSLFASQYAGTMTFSRVFIPQAITPSTKMSSISDGAFMLLQYDECIGSLSVALWAAVLLAQSRNTRRMSENYVTSFIYGTIILALTGPLGFAVACVWARDELVYKSELQSEKKSQ